MLPELYWNSVSSLWLRVIMELWALLWNPKLYWNFGTPSMIRVILELWTSSLNSGIISVNSELYWNSEFHLYSQELYWNSGNISVNSELYWNSGIISVNTRVNLKLKNYLYELRILIELWNNKLSFFQELFSLKYKVSNTAELDCSQALNWTT